MCYIYIYYNAHVFLTWCTVCCNLQYTDIINIRKLAHLCLELCKKEKERKIDCSNYDFVRIAKSEINEHQRSQCLTNVESGHAYSGHLILNHAIHILQVLRRSRLGSWLH